MSKENLSAVAQFFTDDEWSAIESALRDYQDYGDEESDIAENIQSKIYKLFKDWLTLKTHTLHNTFSWKSPHSQHQQPR